MLFMQSKRNGQACFTSYEGTPLDVVVSLMTDIGHTDIEEIGETDFNAAVELLKVRQ